jgi:anti-sigma factor RsiW
MRTGEADQPIRTDRLHGVAAAFWSKGGYGFIVIGGTDPEPVQRAAAELAGQT